MSDYEHARYGRNYPRSPDAGGAGLLWLLVVVAALGAVVFVSIVGNSTVPQGHVPPAAASVD